MSITTTFEVNLRLGRGFKTDAERTAVAAREALKLKSHDRLPARMLAHLLEVDVTTPEALNLPTAVLAELTIDGKNRWSAALVKGPPNYRDLLIHNPTHSLPRQESDIFHELSHHLCKHEPDRIFGFGAFEIREYSREKEDQAEFLGYALHLTKDALFWANRQQMDQEAIGEHFCASAQLVRHRMNVSGTAKILQRMLN